MLTSWNVSRLQDIFSIALQLFDDLWKLSAPPSPVCSEPEYQGGQEQEGADEEGAALFGSCMLGTRMLLNELLRQVRRGVHNTLLYATLGLCIEVEVCLCGIVNKLCLN